MVPRCSTTWRAEYRRVRPSKRGLASHCAVSAISDSNALMAGSWATSDSIDLMAGSLLLLHCRGCRGLEIQVLCDAGAVPAECIHVPADPPPRLRQVFIVEVDVEQIDVPGRLERDGDVGLDDLARDGQRGRLRVVVDIPVAR